jgi:hypothetical protein
MLRFHGGDLLPILVKFITLLLILQHEQLFERTLGNWHAAPPECHHSFLSLKNAFNCKDCHKEVAGNQPALAKGYFCRNVPIYGLRPGVTARGEENTCRTDHRS